MSEPVIVRYPGSYNLLNTSNIVPCQLVNTINSFSVTVMSLTLYTTAILNIQSFDADKNLVISYQLTLTEEEYLAWNNNDDYIKLLVASKLGYTLQ